MQVRDLRAHDDEPRAGDANGRLEIQSTEALADLNMVACLEGQRARLSPAAYFNVSALVLALRHGIMQQVGDAELQIRELVLDCGQPQIRVGELGRQLLASGNQRCNIAALVAFGLGHSNRLGVGVALRTQPVDFDLQRLALLFQGAQRRHVQHKAPAGQIAGNGFRIGTQQLGIDHRATLVGTGLSPDPRPVAWHARVPAPRRS